MPTDTLARLEELLSRRILILDGAMGTMIQGYGLDESDYRGAPACGQRTRNSSPPIRP